MAEREGFEPSRGLSPLLAFQASAFNRSTTSPYPPPTLSVGGPFGFDKRFPRSAPPSVLSVSKGAEALLSVRLVAILSTLLLFGVTPGESQRHAVAGHYRVPNVYVQASVAADAGANAITNSGFETGSINDGWFECGDVDAYTTTAHPYSGAYDEYSGTRNGVGEPLGNSGVCQRVTIPAGAVLTARLYQLSNEGDATFAYQEADLLDDRGYVVVNLYKTVNDKAAWVLGRWDLAAYAGRTYWLYFGVHGDGYSKSATEQFVDDVSLAAPVSHGTK
jgi:hypothetical protein